MSHEAHVHLEHAAQLLRAGDRRSALVHYQRALDALDHPSGPDIPFKAFVAHQYGLCLAKLHGLDGMETTAPPDTWPVLSQVRALWRQALAIYHRVDARTLEVFEREFPLADSIRAIQRDPVMAGEMLIAAGTALAQRGDKQQASLGFERALQFLDWRNPEDRDGVAYCRLRLATLCSDLRRHEEAAAHARWVLDHDPPENDLHRQALEFIQQRRFG